MDAASHTPRHYANEKKARVWRPRFTKFLHLYLTLIIFVMTLPLTSCGLNDEKPADSQVYDLEELEGSCELDTNALKNILEENIESDIDCLETNLNQFADFVRRADSELIGREELKKFMDKFFPESREITGDLLKLVFNVNTLLLRDPVDFIKVRKLPAFFSIIKAVNSDGRYLYQVLKDLNGENYWAKRQQIYFHIESLATKVLNTTARYINTDDFNYELDIESFLEQLKGILKISDDDLNLDSIRPWFFVKKLFLGGRPTVVTSIEFTELLDRASELVITAIDGVFAFKKDHDDLNNQYYYYFSIIEDLRKNIKVFPETEVILTADDLFTMIDTFLSEDDSIKDLEIPITRFKEKFIGGKIDEIQYRDLDKIISWLEEFTGMLYFNAITYDQFKDKMKSPGPISGIQRPKNSFYFNLQKKYLGAYWEQFEYISKNYRFFQDADNKSYLYNYYKRFKSGFQTSSMIRWGLHKALEVYGHYPKGKKIRHIDKDDLRVAMNDLKGLVQFLGFWPEDPERFVAEAIASSDLFMYHSDGSQASSQEELTEYVNNVIHAFGITSQVHKNLKKYCPIIDPDNESVDVLCFREHFLHIFFNELKYQVYYNKLYDFLQDAGVGTLRKYLINIELYARINPDPKVPLTKEDLSRILVILTNLETAFIRFDVNKDSILQRGELDMAFLVFRNLVKDVADLGKEDSALFKSIFLYLIKHMEVPSATKLLWFHAFGSKDGITSSRINISAILRNFSL